MTSNIKVSYYVSMVSKIKNNILILILLSIALFLCFANYTPGTILSGWDTLHPEFDFEINIKREIFGVFRTYQGLGAVAAHSNMADLPHILSLYLFHFLLPMDFLRYAYIFLNLILGAVGMYFFLQRIVLKNKIASFLGGLFYLLNLGAMQQFVVPFEMFTTQYALLPWLFLFTTSYLYSQRNSKKILISFSIATILASPMAFAATLWYVYFLVLIAYLFLLSITSLIGKNFVLPKRAFLLILLTLLLNLYWILPNIYYVFNHGYEVSEASINKLFSPQAFLYNKEFGNILDISLLKSFLFDWSIYKGDDGFGQLLSPWLRHLENPLVLGIGFLFAAVALIGILRTILTKNKILISFVPALLLCLLFLINDNFPTGGIFNFLKDSLPLFKEAYRFPANKVFIIFTFLYAIFFAAGIVVLLDYTKRFSKALLQNGILALSFFTILIVFYMSPSFSGNFISPYMRIEIPQRYFEMFEYFKDKPKDTKIANLPIHSPFGWEYYNWYKNKSSFQGAGFMWFGLEQPLLNRDFDRWSPYNEKYYREMSYAIYSQNPLLLKSTLEKYNIKYLLLDKSIIAPQENPKVLFFEKTESLLENQIYIEKVRGFEGKIIIYEVNLPKTEESITLSPASLIDNQGKILPQIFSLTSENIAFNLNPEKSISLSSYFPPDQLMSLNLIVKKDKGNLYLPSLIPQPFKIQGDFVININKKDVFSVSNLKDNTFLSLGRIYLNKVNENSISVYPQNPSQKITPNFSSLKYSLDLCDNSNTKRPFGINPQKEPNSFSLFANNNHICLTVPLAQLLKNQEIASNSLLGIKLDYETKAYVGICIVDLATNDCSDYGSKHIAIDQSPTKSLIRYFNLNLENINNFGINFYLDARNIENTQEAFYKNISLGLISPSLTTALPNILLPGSATDSANIPLPKSDRLAYSIAKTNETCSNTYYSNPFLEKKLPMDNKEHFIKYVSLEFISCDRFIYSNLPQNQAYVVLVTSKNVEGLPLTFCVENEISKHCDIYATLSSSKTTTTEAFLLPPQIANKAGYNMMITSLGVKESPSINELRNIQVIPLSNNLLSKLIYSSTQPVSQTLLTNSQSFEKGWKAYEMTNGKWQMANNFKNLFPFIFGKELKNHILVNNWTNGWIGLSSGKQNEGDRLQGKRESGVAGLDQTSIIVIFFPQYLEYFGFAVLGISLLFLFFLYLKSLLKGK